MLSWAHLDQILTFLEFHFLKSLEPFTKMPLVFKGIMLKSREIGLDAPRQFFLLHLVLDPTFISIHLYVTCSNWSGPFLLALFGLVRWCWMYPYYNGFTHENWLSSFKWQILYCLGVQNQNLRSLPPNSTIIIFTLTRNGRDRFKKVCVMNSLA